MEAAALDRIDVSSVREEWDRLLQEMRDDPNRTHFRRTEEWDKVSLDDLEPGLRKEFVDFLVSSLTAEFSGCVLYAEMRKRGLLKGFTLRGPLAAGLPGAWRFASEYCFTVANGDIPTEGVMCAQWLAAKGFKNVGLFWEQGSSGVDYAEFFREEAGRLGLTQRIDGSRSLR